ncbi:MAG: group II intron reverse transcriptase/maturase [Geobacteraceae bacterium]
MKAATTTTQTATACASPTAEMNWHQIDWAKCHSNVRRLQVRIVKATKEGRWNKVKALQHLLTHSFNGKVLAVKRVTENTGRKTPGVDGETWSTPRSKMNAAMSLRSRGYKPRPLRRVYIPKANGKKRPLGIPTMKDRAMQALYLLALEPIAETTGDPNSYGFRKERCTADAMAQCFIALAKSKSPQWILEGDIKGCFDNISHEWMEHNIPMDRMVLHKWLKAGFIDNKRLFPTEAGTPQGGIISPVLANMVLDGLEEELRRAFPKGARVTIPNPSGKGAGKRVPNQKQINLIRYADDFVITATQECVLENEVKPLVEKFMRTRGLELSQEKTRISHIEEGFDFLGWNFRKYNGKLLIKPSKDNIKRFLEKIRSVIKVNATAKQENLIKLLNPMIHGWAMYHRGAVASDVFARVHSEIWMALWRWARRRHPRKGRRWVKNKYFQVINGRDWVFSTSSGKGETKTTEALCRASSVKIQRHIKIQSEANPFDPLWDCYFESRRTGKMTTSPSGKRELRALWRKQLGLCPMCKQPITKESGWNVHYIHARVKGGKDINSNRMLLHNNCHNQYHWKYGLETGPLQ